jgi:hypothetical protein
MGNRFWAHSRAAYVVGAGVIVLSLVAATESARAAWQELSRILSLQGKPEPASAGLLSEHHLEALEGMPAQAQAEFLLERSINHYAGANDQIAARVTGWRGKIAGDDRPAGTDRSQRRAGPARECALGYRLARWARRRARTCRADPSRLVA